MKDMGIIQGSAAQAVPLIVGKDTVYVHTDITAVTQDNAGNPVEDLFQFHEVQYDKDEYIEFQGESLEKQRSDIDFMAVMTGVDLDV